MSNDVRVDPWSLEFLELQAADAGILGGGISFCCFDSSFSAAACARCEAFDELRFQVRLSLRRNDVVEAGVLGSSELEVLADGLGA